MLSMLFFFITDVILPFANKNNPSMQTAATMEIVIVIVVLNFLFFIFSRPFFSDFFYSITFLFVCIDLLRTIFDLLRI